jgi:hypothetical protein
MRIYIVILLFISKIIFQDGNVSLHTFALELQSSQEIEGSPMSEEVEETQLAILHSSERPLKFVATCGAKTP